MSVQHEVEQVDQQQQENEFLLKSKDSGNFTTGIYRVRWFVLGVFVSHMMSNNAIWISFSPITTIIQCYYSVSLFWVNALSWIYMLTYLLFSLLAIWFLERWGIKWTAVVAGTFNAAGAWLRFAGTSPQMFWLLFVGQTIASGTYLMENNGCSKLSARWFPPHERATATTLYFIISSQFGVLIGLLAAPLVVTGGDNTDFVCNSTAVVSVDEYKTWQSVTYDQLFYYLLGQAILATVVLPLTYIMPEAPPIPPSITAHIGEERPNASFLTLLRQAFSNGYFVMFLFADSLIIGASGAYVTVFQEVLHNAGYQHYQGLIGYLGASMTASSIVGVLLVGRWIDYSKTYYMTILIAIFSSVLITLALSLSVQFGLHFYIVFITATLTSCVLSLTGGIGVEYAAEMTFPLPESISAGLINTAFQITGILTIVAVTLLVQYRLALYGNYIFSGLLLLASIVLVFVRPTLRRVKIEKEHTQ